MILNFNQKEMISSQIKTFVDIKQPVIFSKPFPALPVQGPLIVDFIKMLYLQA